MKQLLLFLKAPFLNRGLIKSMTVLIGFLFLKEIVCGQGRTIRIEFNEKGQMISSPPAFLTENDDVYFVVNTSQDFRAKRISDTYKRFQQTIQALDEQEAGKYKLLKALGLQENADAQNLIQVAEDKFCEEIITFLKAYKDDLKDQVDVDGQIIKLQRKAGQLAIKPFSDIKDLIQMPSTKALLFPSFQVKAKFVNVNGLDKATECLTDLKLDPCPTNCGATYTGKLDLSSLKRGPVRFEFDLRMNNNVGNQIIQQINSSSKLTGKLWMIDAATLKKDLNGAISLSTFLGGSSIKQDDLDKLKKWISAKEADDTVDPPAELVTAMTQPKIKAVKEKLDELFSTTYANLRTPEAIAWILQFSWISGGQNLSANPLVNSNLVGAGAQLAAISKSIKALKKDSANYVLRLAIIENSSKAANSANNINSLSDDYKTLLDSQKKSQSNLDDANSKLKDLKSQVSGDVVNQLNRPSVVSDSLLYQGQLYFNRNPYWSVFGGLFNPNNIGYAFMRNHNALEDFQLQGKHPAKGVNETQRMYILITNASTKTKYILKTTITPIALKDDNTVIDNETNFSAEFKVITKQPIDFQTPIDPANTFEQLFISYEKVKKLFTPFQNGILTTPIPINSDKTPDYITRIVSHESPFSAPSSVSYQIIDSATTKNLNSEATAYTYRYNKLYRFRIKAGIVYSFLQSRNYSINSTTNTATYTNSYTGLAPSAGFQIFTTRLDVQSTKLFPHGLAPFGYVGYIYTGAPAANMLVGGGYEIFSGIAVIGGVHFGKTEGVDLVAGTLQEKDHYAHAAFISVNIGLEAFSALFNTAKPTTNPFSK